MYYGLKQGQITPNFEEYYVLKLIHLVVQCSKITNTVLFLKRILHHFFAFCCFLLVMSECPKVHFVALGFIYGIADNIDHLALILHLYRNNINIKQTNILF